LAVSGPKRHFFQEKLTLPELFETDMVLPTIPNEGLMISKVFMITFDLLAAWGKPQASSFYPIQYA
jgi:hypothetical protein